jgi:hypothetical protein
MISTLDEREPPASRHCSGPRASRSAWSSLSNGVPGHEPSVMRCVGPEAGVVGSGLSALRSAAPDTLFSALKARPRPPIAQKTSRREPASSGLTPGGVAARRQVSARLSPRAAGRSLSPFGLPGQRLHGNAARQPLYSCFPALWRPAPTITGAQPAAPGPGGANGQPRTGNAAYYSGTVTAPPSSRPPRVPRADRSRQAHGRGGKVTWRQVA